MKIDLADQFTCKKILLYSLPNIGTMLAGRLPYTIELSFYGLLLATVIGLVLGFLSAFMKNTVVDYFCTSISVFGMTKHCLGTM